MAKFGNDIFGFRVDLGGLWKGNGDGKPESLKKADMRAFEKTMDSFMKDALDHIRVLLKQAAIDFAYRVQNYIYNQEGKMGWAPLTEDYAKWKENNGLDDRTLIATGEYASRIQPQPMRDRLGRFTSFRTISAAQVPDARIRVGLPGTSIKTDEDGAPDSDAPSYRQLGMWLEFGTSSMPARPHFGPASFLFKSRELPRIMADVGKYMTKLGYSAKSNNPHPMPPADPSKGNPKPDTDVKPDSNIRPDQDIRMPPDRD